MNFELDVEVISPMGLHLDSLNSLEQSPDRAKKEIPSINFDASQWTEGNKKPDLYLDNMLSSTNVGYLHNFF